MENNNFRGIPTSLFLNGPKLGIVTDPQSVSNVIGVATFTGIATATFPDTNFDFDGGSIAFKWYFDGSRILDTSEDSNSNAEIVGFSSATGTGSTITVNGLTVGDDGKEVYFETTYIGSAYETTSPRTAGTAMHLMNHFSQVSQQYQYFQLLKLHPNQKVWLLEKLLKQVIPLRQEQLQEVDQ